MTDPSEFGSSDELGMDYLDEIHPLLSSDDIDELDGLATDYIIVEEEVSEFSELNFDNDNGEK